MVKFVGTLAVLSLLPFSGKASAFDRHFGNYTVVSTTNEIEPTCPLETAKINRQLFGGFQSIVLEAKGRQGDCESQVQSVLSVQGMPGVTCNEAADAIHCVHPRGSFDVNVRTAADGTVRLKIIYDRIEETAIIWTLRKEKTL